MFRVYFIWMVLFTALVSAGGSTSFIVLTQGSSEESVKERQEAYRTIIQTDTATHFLLEEEKISSNITQVRDVYLLKVGPFRNSDTLAIVYLTVKQSFPQSFIMESTEPQIKEVEREVIREVAKEDIPLWIAIFGLAVIGVLFMFLSSDKINHLKLEYQKLKKRHQRLEEKQHEVLSTMGENIHAMTKETIGHTKELASHVKDAPLHSQLEKVMDHENELLDITGELIGFLRLKSKKVVMQHEVFNFNNVLNDVAGVLQTVYGQNDTELVFDISQNIPQTMLADSLHLGQVLMNILEYVIDHSRDKEVRLRVERDSKITESLRIKFAIEADMMIENQEKIFEYRYDEEKRRYIGLGLYMAKEYVHLMSGALHIEKHSNGKDGFTFTLPMQEKRGEKQKAIKELAGKKVLIVDESSAPLLILQRLFERFKTKVETILAEEFQRSLPSFRSYDIVVLSEKIFASDRLETLRYAKKDYGLKIIRLGSIFSSYPAGKYDFIDSELKKPLNYDTLFDVLRELYENGSVEVGKTEESKERLLPIYRDDFKSTPNVTLESFAHFKGKHLLIVEDNQINQKVIINVLSKSGMKLSTVDNGKEAVDFLCDLKDECVDLVLMDINMPTMDGYRAVELIRTNARFDKVPIVALTALVLENEIEKMFECGMNGYLAKPIKIEQLYSVLYTFLKEEKQPDRVKYAATQKSLTLDGLDIKDGILRMRGNEALYKELLQEFSDAYSKSDELFEKLVKEQRYEQVKMLCLDMKGLTGTIGAKKMHYIISEIHQYLVNKKPELLHSYTERYRAELSRLNNAIGTYLA